MAKTNTIVKQLSSNKKKSNSSVSHMSVHFLGSEPDDFVLKYLLKDFWVVNRPARWSQCLLLGH